MGKDTRKDESRHEMENPTDRRKFLRQAGMIGGGALAALAGLASVGDAQQDIRIRPESNMGNVQIPGPMPPIKADNVASVEHFRKLFAQMKTAYPPETSPELGKEALGRMAEMMADMSPASRAGGVSILQMRQRFPNSPNVGRNLVVLFNTIGAGIEATREQSVSAGAGGGPHAMGSGCGDGCGSGCGTGCMSAITGGFACGNGCGQGCPGVDVAGVICGGGCEATGLEQLSFDRQGVALEGVKMKGLNMKNMAAAMGNADRAYNQVFGTRDR